MKNEKENLISRPPVVVVLGHVDHGKTSILDFIRKSKVVEKESGGITQHIGAYQIMHQEKEITFIDTPGHEAFGAMRSRGARVADIAVLVVAGEEGIKPQTKEAITCIKKAGIPMIVAINKMDKPEADSEKVKRELSKADILVESLGGEILSMETSAKTGKGIKELLDLILLVAEMEGLKANLNDKAEGVVIESYLDQKRGPVAILLVRSGVLKIGDFLGTFSAFGKIKILEDFQKKNIEFVFPSVPCFILGFQKVPGVGEKFKTFDSLELAEQYTQGKQEKAEDSQVIINEEGIKILNLILKADVFGSLEAIEGVLKDLPQEKVCLRILKNGVGEITSEDIGLAQASKARIIGFRVKANKDTRDEADRKNITIISFDVIYDLSQAVRNLMEKFLKPEIERSNIGKVKVLAIFRREKNRQIIGGKVIRGEAEKGTKVEVIRGEEVIGTGGKVVNFQKDKKEAEKAIKGQECGMLYEGSVRIEPGDVLELYIEGKKKSEL